ncbi:MAG: competence/damage-inducible protein A [Verrucomicrobiota bacterium]
MRVVIINTGTELLLGDVRDAHLSFVAQQILPLGLRIQEQRTVPDGVAIRETLEHVFPRADLVIVTGGLGPTTDDITREIVAEVLDLQLVHDEKVMSTITERLEKRRIPFTDRIARQADVPAGAVVLPNQNGTAPGFYLPQNINPRIPSPHLLVLPGPPRELQPMFRESAMPILRKIAPASTVERRVYRIAGMGESIVERAVGKKILAIPGIELGYCARPSEVDLRILGDAGAIAGADEIIRKEIGLSIFSEKDENLEQVVVKLLGGRRATLAVAESCTGGLLAHRITNVPGSSDVFVAGYVTYANAAKIDILGVDPKSIEEHGAVSELVARNMAEGALARAGSTYALATTGIAGPGGGTAEKEVGTVYIALAAPEETVARKLFFPTDRETFKQMTAQAALDLLRRKLLAGVA